MKSVITKKILGDILTNAAVTTAVVLFLSWRITGQIQDLKKFSLEKFSLKTYLTVDENRIKTIAQSITLNQLLPDLRILFSLQEGQKADFTQIRRYYQKVVAYYPDLTEAYVILGLCDYADGNTAQAFDILKKSYEKDSGAFWTTYNLGVLCLRRGDTDHAKIFFDQAVHSSPELNLRRMLTSPIYRQIFVIFNLSPEKISKYLNQAYEDCQRGLGLAEIYSKQPFLINSNLPNIPKPRIF